MSGIKILNLKHLSVKKREKENESETNTSAVCFYVLS